MRKYLLLVLIAVGLMPLLSGCGVQMGAVVPMGDNIYNLTGNGKSGFVPLGKIRKTVLEVADEYARKKNTTMELISVDETKAGYAIWPQIDLVFRLADYDVPQVEMPVTLKDKQKPQNDKIQRLRNLAELRDEGIISEKEFQREKEKILNE